MLVSVMISLAKCNIQIGVAVLAAPNWISLFILCYEKLGSLIHLKANLVGEFGVLLRARYLQLKDMEHAILE